MGTLCRASACADAPGRQRPTAGRRPMAGDFSRHAGSYNKTQIIKSQENNRMTTWPLGEIAGNRAVP